MRAGGKAMRRVLSPSPMRLTSSFQSVLDLYPSANADDVFALNHHDGSHFEEGKDSVSPPLEALQTLLEGIWACKETDAETVLSSLAEIAHDTGDANISVQQQLLINLYRCMTPSEGESKEHASPEAWVASEVMLELLSAPGASAYSMFHSTVYSKILYWLRMWCKSSPSFAPVSAAASTEAAAGNKSFRGKRQRNESSQGGRGEVSDEEGGEVDDEDIMSTSMSQSVASRGSLETVLAITLLLGQSLGSVPLLLHEDIRQGLAEALVMVLIVSALNGHKELNSASKMALCEFGAHSSEAGSANVLGTAALQTLLPVILMQVGHPGVPVRGKDRLKAHMCAIDMALLLSERLCAGRAEEEGQASAQSTATAMSPMSPASEDDEELGLCPNPVLVLLQHLCVRAPDRAETRVRTAQMLGQILCVMSPPDARRFIRFLVKLSRSNRIVHRSFAVEAASKLLHLKWLWESMANTGAPNALFNLILGRCVDKAPTIRSKAAAAISWLLEPLAARGGRDVPEGLRVAALSSTIGKDEEGGRLLTILRSRVQDDKAAVRRHAVSALENLLLVTLLPNPPPAALLSPGSTASPSPLSTSCAPLAQLDLQLLERRCNDTSVATRKAAMSALSSLALAVPCAEPVQETWVRALLPLAQDPEATCQAKLCELVQLVICDRIVQWREEVRHPIHPSLIAEQGFLRTNEKYAVWGLLGCLRGEKNIACLKRAMSALVAGKGASSGQRIAGTPFDSRQVLEALRDAAILATLTSRGKQPASCQDSAQVDVWAALSKSMPQAELATVRSGCWKLLEAILDVKALPGSESVMEGATTIEPTFVVDCWNQLSLVLLQAPQKDAEADARRVLSVMARVAARIPSGMSLPLIDQLKDAIVGMHAGPETSGSILFALKELTFAAAASPEEAAQECEVWVTLILVRCESVLKEYVQGGPLSSSRGGDLASSAQARHALYLLGEAIMVGFSGNGERSQFQPNVPADLVKLVQVLLPPALPGVGGKLVPASVRALAFVSLGKLCLRDQGLAKESINVLLQELASSDSPAIRSNALIVLGDLCVRYTSLVDRHVGAMATSMQDASPLVRRHALLLLGQLLLQDYVKWRGLLLFRFLAALVDPDPSIAELARFTLTGPLMQKSPHIFAQHFVESIIVLNGFSEHPMYIAARAVGAESGAGVTMEGINLSEHDRQEIYTAMLEHMTDEQRIQVAAKLAHDILGAAVEGGLPVIPRAGVSPSMQAKAESVCRDAFVVMSSPGLRVGAGARGGDEIEDEEILSEEAATQGPQGRMKAAKSKLLKTMSRKHLMEHVVPVLISLKHVLEKGNSPLQRELMGYFRELLRQYKAEVKEVLAAEPTLACEIEYDLKQWEREERERKRRASLSRASITRDSLLEVASPRKGTPRGSSPKKAAALSPPAATPNASRRLSMSHRKPIMSSAIRRASFGGRPAGPCGSTPMSIARAASRTPTASILAGRRAAAQNRTPLQAIGTVLGRDMSEVKSSVAKRIIISTPSSGLHPVSGSKRRWSVSLKPSEVLCANENGDPSDIEEVSGS